jgi:MFS transporter, PAT family, beta-lactamase induction signal transducer AmpG
MRQQQFANPFYIFFLVLPAGISFGFVQITLPYLLTDKGFPVVETAAIVAIGVSANLWRFVWGPVADLTLSLTKWFWIGVVASTSMLLILCLTPFTIKGQELLITVVFISQVAATFVLLPVAGFMAHRIEESKKGSAAGWYQAGNLGGIGVGGGAGLWLANHYSVEIAGIVLCSASLFFSLSILLIKDVQPDKGKTIVQELKIMGKDLLSMLRIPVLLFVIILLIMPMGSGAAANLWSAIARDWKTNADTVALVTGLLSGIISAIGCIAGGYVADRWGVWLAYLGACVVCAIVPLVMSFLPYQPSVFIGGVLAYSFALGLINAGFSAVLLYAIGKKNAATKYSLLSSWGNLPVVYITAFDGWTHDRFNSKYMLTAEALLGIAAVIISTIVLRRLMYKKLIPKTID